jgi:hypothetical protein
MWYWLPMPLVTATNMPRSGGNAIVGYHLIFTGDDLNRRNEAEQNICRRMSETRIPPPFRTERSNLFEGFDAMKHLLYCWRISCGAFPIDPAGGRKCRKNRGMDFGFPTHEMRTVCGFRAEGLYGAHPGLPQEGRYEKCPAGPYSRPLHRNIRSRRLQPRTPD